METHTEVSPLPLGYPSTPPARTFQKEVTTAHLDAGELSGQGYASQGASRPVLSWEFFQAKRELLFTYSFGLLRLWSKRREPLLEQEAK